MRAFGTSGFIDVDTIIANNGGVVKVPTDAIIIISDPDSIQSFDPTTNVPGLTGSLPFADALPDFFGLRGKFVCDPQSTFGPFYDPNGVRVGNPQPIR